MLENAGRRRYNNINEKEKDAVLADLLDWLQKHLPSDVAAEGETQ